MRLSIKITGLNKKSLTEISQGMLLLLQGNHVAMRMRYGASPTFAIRGLENSKRLIAKETTSKGLHYTKALSRGIGCTCFAVILGGGCLGNCQSSRSRII